MYKKRNPISHKTIDTMDIELGFFYDLGHPKHCGTYTESRKSILEFSLNYQSSSDFQSTFHYGVMSLTLILEVSFEEN